MGETPETGQERLILRYLRAAGRLVHFFSTLTACCILFCIVALMSYLNDITRQETFVEKQCFYRADPRGSFHSWSRKTLRHFLCGKGEFNKQQFGSLAFGGRGVGLLHNSANWTVAHKRFDSTKGFPGEGWSNKHPNFKIATWNTRSMTFERFTFTANP